ncbi:MAG: FHA domain-containing protein [Anaerolineae bacterium]|nr:FHA domain-containing protein [Anaerolineae bacterium]
MEAKRPSETRLLPPLSQQGKDFYYRTHIMSQSTSLRRMLSNIPGRTGESASVAAPTKVTLIIRGIPESFTLSEKQIVLLGRADFRSGGFQPDVDLTRYGGHERGVSRAHARLHVLEGEVYVTDLYSANGTFIGGERLEPEKPRLLKNGEELTLGTLPIRVKFE